MKITKRLCDVTGDEGFTIPLEVREEVRTCRLDAAGDTEEEFSWEKVEYDLSHLGAVTLIRTLLHNDKSNVLAELKKAQEETRKRMEKKRL